MSSDTTISRRSALLAAGHLALTACTRTAERPVAASTKPADGQLTSAQIDAIGRVIDLPDDIQPAFTGKGFEPPPPVREGRWRAVHAETPQGFEAYVRTFPHVPSMERNTLLLQPVGEVKVKPEIVREYLEIFYGLPVGLLPPDSSEAWAALSRVDAVTKVRHLFASDALRYLRAQVQPSSFAVIGMTEDALHSDGSWGLVFGANLPDERVGIFTFDRAVPSIPRGTNVAEDPVLLGRYLKAATHEVGHAFGFAHCAFFRCVMAGAIDVEEASQRPMYACPVCLRKLHWATRVNIANRYRRLAAFYGQYGFEADAQWANERLRELPAQT